jgi:hypothetical protein
MAYASLSGRARTSAKSPRAFAVCQRCGLWDNRDRMQFQMAWRGTTLRNIYILVCGRCYDTPQEQLRSITIPADPTPVYYPSVEDFAAAETNYRITVPGTVDFVTNIPKPSDDFRVTMDCQNRVTQEIGAPRGLDQNAVMPYNGAVQRAYGVVLSPLSLTSNGTAAVTATFSAAHGLCTNDQIAIEGLTNPLAAGFFSVTVSNPMTFTYMTNVNVAAASLLTGTSRMITVLVGLPYGDEQIPQVDQ